MKAKGNSMIKIINACLLGFFVLTLSACSDTISTSGGLIFSEPTATIGGTVGSRRAMRNGKVFALTHVMAINPETSNPRRFLGTVSVDGSFSLTVELNRPYILVFLDSNPALIGTDKIISIFQAGTLDSILSTGDDFDMGTIDISGPVASTDILYAELLSRMGIDAGTALTIGAADNISLRYANPDINGNGVVDQLEDLEVALDFHVRSASKIIGNDMQVSDVTNGFAPSTGVNRFQAEFNLASIYLLTPTAADNTSTCVAANDINFPTCNYTSSPLIYPYFSFSSLSFNDINGFGPDYDLANGQEMPGSDGDGPQTLAFETTLATYTFANVVTKSKAELEADGTIVPFIRFNTLNEGVKIESLQYKWMKNTAGDWTEASEDEVKTIVNDDGGFAIFYLNFDRNTVERQHHIGFSIPRTANGIIPFTLAAADDVSDELSSGLAATIEVGDICNSAVSYDDKLGLRIFAGSPSANAGTTVCN